MQSNNPGSSFHGFDPESVQIQTHEVENSNHLAPGDVGMYNDDEFTGESLEVSAVPKFIENWQKRQIKGNESFDDSHLFLRLQDPDGYQVYLGGRKQLMMIMGDMGSRKTLVSAMLMMTLWSDNDDDLTMGAFMTKEARKDESYIIRFDTEQDGYDIFENRHRFHKFIQEDPVTNTRLLEYSVEDLDHNEIIQYIEYVLKEVTEQKGHPPLWVMLDQAADCLPNADINDRAAGARLYRQIRKWQNEYNCFFSIVFHTTPESGRAGGQVGRFFEKKCTCIIKTELEKPEDSTEWITRVSCAKARRSRRFSDIHITQEGSLGRPVLYGSKERGVKF